MILKNTPRREARKLVDQLVDKLLDAGCKWVAKEMRFTHGVYSIYAPDATLYLSGGVEVWLPFLQRRRLLRALRTRLCYEAQKAPTKGD